MLTLQMPPMLGSLGLTKAILCFRRLPARTSIIIVLCSFHKSGVQWGINDYECWPETCCKLIHLTLGNVHCAARSKESQIPVWLLPPEASDLFRVDLAAHGKDFLTSLGFHRRVTERICIVVRAKVSLILSANWSCGTRISKTLPVSSFFTIR